MRAFLDKVALPVHSEDEADAISRMFAGDAWFRDELERQARAALLARHRPLDWLGDIVDEALVRFREQLRAAPDLGVDRRRVEQTFPTWIAARLRNTSCDAIDYLHRLHGRDQSVTHEAVDPHAAPPIDEWIDVRKAIDRLAKPVRAVLVLHETGMTISEIAVTLGKNYWEIRRLLHAGLDELAARLCAYRNGPEKPPSARPI